MFYQPNISQQTFELNEEESFHLMKVLRKKENDLIQVTDGTGNEYECKIELFHKKNVLVRIISEKKHEKRDKYLHIAIAPTKNLDRIEWFLEKATEIGIEEISFIITDKSERREIKNMERLQKIIISAMKQSMQFYLPKLNLPVKFDQFLKTLPNYPKYIAYCGEVEKKGLPDLQDESKALIMIGPEGDFTTSELNLTLKNGFFPISLGETRLRTETAAVVVSAAFSLSNS